MFTEFNSIPSDSSKFWILFLYHTWLIEDTLAKKKKKMQDLLTQANNCDQGYMAAAWVWMYKNYFSCCWKTKSGLKCKNIHLKIFTFYQ